MSDQSTEQKKHPATLTKLRRLRDEGQLPHSPDLRGFLLLSGVIALSWALFDYIRAAFNSFLLHGLLLLKPGMEPPTLGSAMFTFPLVCGTAALVVVIFVITIGFAAADMHGINLSARSFKDGFKRISPMSNLKEKFSARAMHDLTRSLIFTIVLAVTIGFLAYLDFSSMFAAPLCGSACTEKVSSQIGARVAFVLCMLLLVMALAEYIASRAFFAQQNKMTETELKRENKENYGSPELRSHMKELRQNILEGKRHARSNANIVIHDDRSIFYIDFTGSNGEPPVCTNITRPAELVAELSAARSAGLQVIEDRVAAAALNNARRGEGIPEESFDAVAAAFRRIMMI